MALLHPRAEAQEQIGVLFFVRFYCYGRCSRLYVASIMLYDSTTAESCFAKAVTKDLGNNREKFFVECLAFVSEIVATES